MEPKTENAVTKHQTILGKRDFTQYNQEKEEVIPKVAGESKSEVVSQKEYRALSDMA